MIEYGVNFDLDLLWAQLIGQTDQPDEMAEQLYAERMGWA